MSCQRFRESYPRITTRFTMKCAVAIVLLATVFCPVSEGLKTVNPYDGNSADKANYFFDAYPVDVDSTYIYMSVKVNSVESSIGFLSVDFGEGGPTSVRVKVGTSYQDGQRVMVNFHLDSPTTQPFATVEILNTGSLTTYEGFDADIAVPPTGVHDMYITFASVDQLDTICYFDWFQFFV